MSIFGSKDESPESLQFRVVEHGFDKRTSYSATAMLRKNEDR